MKEKKILIFGITNKFSISYSIAQSMTKQGAKIFLTYKEKKFKKKIKKISNKLKPLSIFKCDILSNQEIEKLKEKIEKKWKKIDGIVHSIAYTKANQLKGDYIDLINREDFNNTHEVTSYSFINLAKIFKNILNKNSSLLTLTYFGSKKVIPNYNIMGVAKASLEANVRYMANSLGKNNIRVNAISAGPVKTSSSYTIKNFNKISQYYKLNCPLKRLITKEEIGNCAAFLCSDLSSGITGEIIYVDGGFNISPFGNIENKS